MLIDLRFKKSCGFINLKEQFDGFYEGVYGSKHDRNDRRNSSLRKYCDDGYAYKMERKHDDGLTFKNPQLLGYEHR